MGCYGNPSQQRISPELGEIGELLLIYHPPETQANALERYSSLPQILAAFIG